MFLNHSGATYPFAPMMVVCVWHWSIIKSFAKPKSDILTLLCLSRSMLWGFISQWMIWLLHSSCKYKSPLDMPNAILVLCFQLGFESPKRKVVRVPLLKNSYTSKRCCLLSQYPIRRTRFLWWVWQMGLFQSWIPSHHLVQHKFSFITATNAFYSFPL